MPLQQYFSYIVVATSTLMFKTECLFDLTCLSLIAITRNSHSGIGVNRTVWGGSLGRKSESSVGGGQVLDQSWYSGVGVGFKAYPYIPRHQLDTIYFAAMQ